jgi:hypothetical protein
MNEYVDMPVDDGCYFCEHTRTMNSDEGKYAVCLHPEAQEMLKTCKPLHCPFQELKPITHIKTMVTITEKKHDRK